MGNETVSLTSGQYCGFKIDGEQFAISVEDVQEVIKPQPITAIPLAQNEIRGLINLRGQIVTCLSLKVLFGKTDQLDREYMNIIVKGKDGLFALLVDEVTDIIDIDKSQLESTPSTISHHLKKYVSSVYKKRNGLVILLNVKNLIELKKEMDL
jgi:purine-binding chemotaxis protein CheW